MCDEGKKFVQPGNAKVALFFNGLEQLHKTLVNDLLVSIKKAIVRQKHLIKLM